MLDFEGDQSKLGKPTNADLSLGLATAPVFFAVQEDKSLRPLVLRRFNQPGDVEVVRVFRLPPLTARLPMGPASYRQRQVSGRQKLWRALAS